jgi:hypothetical protein
VATLLNTSWGLPPPSSTTLAPCLTPAGKYLKREVLNLARFISVMKTRPLTWRLAHPYVIADRFEVRARHCAHTHAPCLLRTCPLVAYTPRCAPRACCTPLARAMLVFSASAASVPAPAATRMAI